ncbi:MAG: hypothetical protein GWP75_01610, partial [Planctomycetia bacterium]|nr:hypothetical protein [Planctomycetia bacterium]
LESIRNDFARPVVHARNLFHNSAAMWDAWACFESGPTPWLFAEDELIAADVEAARREAISYAVYRILRHRFAESPGFEEMAPQYDALMVELGYDPAYTETVGNDPAAIGNRIAQTYILFGESDNANEQDDYANQWYRPVNLPIFPEEPGNLLQRPNRWQPIGFEEFIDQSGNVIEGGVPPFLGPEWGSVTPFSLRPDQRTTNQRDGHDWYLYLDPGSPPLIGTDREVEYLEGFEQVLVWSSHLDAEDAVQIDASPNAIGNADLPTDPADFDGFYDYFAGGDASQGYGANPVTGEPYPVQLVPRGDYTRVLAEFWADGPDSETPPGHWFTILNDVMDHPEFVRRIGGAGPVLGELEYDVKAYLAMGGCMHDAAIAAWGVKGWYDYVRPVSVVRWMAENGQRTDPKLPNYHPRGLRLISGLVEVVTEETIAPGERHEHLAGVGNANVGKIAAFCWRGPEFINDPEIDTAGCGWTLAEMWWPYQRPTFVTPNFAGYVSGHSTFSRAAAELMTRMTGSEYFPGGLGEYLARRGQFLVFENGPSVDVRLQWVSYRDASDQCSLSRIWGGIHPPADDLPGRLMGLVIGPQAWDRAVELYEGGASCAEDINGDGIVNAADLGALVGDWGCTGPDCVADVNQDGIVNSADLGLVIGAWNQDC